MSGGKLFLFLIAIVILVFIALSGKKIAGTIQTRLSQARTATQSRQISPTPTPQTQTGPIGELNEPINKTYEETNEGKGFSNLSQTREIPATGPNGISLLLLSGGFAAGLTLLRIKRR